MQPAQERCAYYRRIAPCSARTARGDCTDLRNAGELRSGARITGESRRAAPGRPGEIARICGMRARCGAVRVYYRQIAPYSARMARGDCADLRNAGELRSGARITGRLRHAAPERLRAVCAGKAPGRSAPVWKRASFPGEKPFRLTASRWRPSGWRPDGGSKPCCCRGCGCW